MAKTTLAPWHQVCKLRDDLRTGELSLAIFAADLYDVVMGKAKPVYQQSKEFFALTYPTFNLRELVKDVLVRLSGKNDKAVRQLELTYGGGKTHTLITLLHLVSDPDTLPDLPAVHEFTNHAGVKPPPRAHVAVLPFDKLDVEVGMDVPSPHGETRRLRHPWSVLAYQMAGDKGLQLLSGGKADERESPPAENLLRELAELPLAQNKATLILIDEVLMFARQKVELHESWRDKLLDFFQCLTQAVSKVDRAAIVASLLATDPKRSDALGKSLTQELYDIFRRQREEGVEPVVKEDVAEVLRRRFFTPDSIRDPEVFRPHVIAALQGIKTLDDITARDAQNAEERFLRSYPFHPDLTDVLYSKWTALEGFQRTRGVLRTFALALRDAERWDTSPLVGTNVFLTAPDKEGIAEAARELTSVASHEDTGGRRQDWNGILAGELSKARQIQLEQPGLKCREIEQAVYATFLHSQPIGRKALTRDLLLLLGPSRPDKIELEKGLKRWAEISWFLDEADTTVEPGELPKAWRLGSRPNLTQMHSDACRRVNAEVVEETLIQHIGALKKLTEGASAAGARVHNLPEKPSDVGDDAEFRYVVLGPKAASDSGKPSAEARRFINEKTGSENPRVYRNAVVCAVPSYDGLEVARAVVRECLGWVEVSQMKEIKESNDEIRKARVSTNIQKAKVRISEVIAQAYCIVVTVNDKNEVQAFKVTVGSDPLFVTIKNDPRSRIQDKPMNAEALLPEGPYDLWKGGETSRRVKDLAGAFAQFPHLPKVLRRKEILDTLKQGAQDGLFVLRQTRPDKSVRTFWRQDVSDEDMNDATLEVVLPEAATLTEISSHLLAPGVLRGLWKDATTPITCGDVVAYFDGTRTITIPKEGYEETYPVPKAERVALNTATVQAIQQGRLWLTTSAGASVFKEECPHTLLTDDAQLNPPPPEISPQDILPDYLPEAWQNGTTTASDIAHALYQRKGVNLPWAIVREAIDNAYRVQVIERAPDSGAWPCDWASASAVKLRIPEKQPLTPIPQPQPSGPKPLAAEAELTTAEIQDLADNVSDVASAAIGHQLKFVLRVELPAEPPPNEEVVARINEALGKVSPKLELKKEKHS